MTIGVLVMAYGTPRAPEEIETFYTDVRRGRPPTPEQLADLERRYAAIGGVSPLFERSAAQITTLGAALEITAPGVFQTFFGAKHSAPKIEDTIAAMASDGIERFVGLVLAPHYSRASVGEYCQRAQAAGELHQMRSVFIEHWHDDPALVELLAQRVADELTRSAVTGRTEVVITAHSLPLRALGDGDPYVDQVRESAELIRRAGDFPHVRVAWQSAGRTPDPWIGPDIKETLVELANDGVAGVVVCPAGFTADHLEILYDLDIEAKAVAHDLGLAFSRTASLNDDALLAAALARHVVESATLKWSSLTPDVPSA